VFNVGLFARNRPFAFSNLSALVNYSATSAVTFLLSLYLQYIHRLSPQQAGLVLIAQPAVQVVLSPLAGRLSDRVEARVVASAGMACTAAGLILLFLVGPATPVWQIVARLGLMGFGFGLFSSPNMSAIMGSVERRHYSIASGTLATMRLLGQTLSMGITLLLFSVFIGQVQITSAVYPAFLASMKATFAIFAVLCVGGTFASLARGKVSGESTHAHRAETELPAPSDR
jgi:MFS family permease